MATWERIGGINGSWAKSTVPGTFSALVNLLHGFTILRSDLCLIQYGCLRSFAIAIECKDGQRRHETQRPVTPTPLIGLRRHFVLFGKRAQELDVIPACDRSPRQRQAQRSARRVSVRFLPRTGNREQQQHRRRSSPSSHGRWRRTASYGRSSYALRAGCGRTPSC